MYGHCWYPIAIISRYSMLRNFFVSIILILTTTLCWIVPGPGVAMIASGVYVVSTEFEFARSWLETVKTKYGTVFDRLGIEVATPEALPAPKGSSPILSVPPSLPIEDVDAEIKTSNEDETDDHKKVGGDETEEHSTLLAADDDKDRKDSSNETQAMTMRI